MDGWTGFGVGFVLITYYWWPAWVQRIRYGPPKKRIRYDHRTKEYIDPVTGVRTRCRGAAVAVPDDHSPGSAMRHDMRGESGDDAAADWAARVATSKAEKKAAKAASSAAYLKAHGPGTSRGQG
jgi:hypothetical protein